MLLYNEYEFQSELKTAVEVNILELFREYMRESREIGDHFVSMVDKDIGCVLGQSLTELTLGVLVLNPT